MWHRAVFVIVVALTVIGCNQAANNTRVGDAPRTETASPSGWKEIKTSGFAISFPSDWTAIDLAAKDVKKAVNDAFGKDPANAAISSQVDQVLQNHSIKLMVFSPKNSEPGFRPNCNVIILDAPAGIKFDDIVAQNVAQLKTMVGNDDPQLSYVDAPVGKVAKIVYHLKSQTTADPVTTGYIALKGQTMAVITFATTKNDTEMDKISDQSVKTFRID